MHQVFKDSLEPFSYLVYAISLIIMLTRSKSPGLRVLLIYYLLAIPLMFVAVFTTTQVINRTLYNSFFFISVSVFSYYFRTILFNKTRRMIIAFVFITNLVLFIIYDLVPQGILKIHTPLYAITYMSIVIYALLYFEHLMRNVNELNLLHRFDFWLVSGYLLYFFSSFFIILFYDNVEVNERAILWSLQNVILFISSLLTMSGSIWIYHQKESF